MPRTVRFVRIRPQARLRAQIPCPRDDLRKLSKRAHRGTSSMRSCPPSLRAGAGAAQPYGPSRCYHTSTSMPRLAAHSSPAGSSAPWPTPSWMPASSGFQLNRALLARFWRMSSRSRTPSSLHRAARSTLRSLRQVASRAARRAALRGPTSERSEPSRDSLCVLLPCYLLCGLV